MTTDHVIFEASMSVASGFDAIFAQHNERWDVARRLYENYCRLLNSEDSPGFRIPKIIHQIWLGGKLPDIYKNIQNSWKLFHPNWEYVLWTDSDVSKMSLVNEDAFSKTENPGAKSDILRYEILLKYGGLYVDTDFECLRSFDLLHRICDFYTGIPHGKEILLNNALIAATPGHPVMDTCVRSIRPMLKSQDPNHIMNTNGPQFFTECFFRSYLVNPAIVVLPATYFYPFPGHLRDMRSKDEQAALAYIRPESYAIHYWDVSWMKRHWIETALLNMIRPLLNSISPETRRKLKSVLMR
jgi:mannosyltransferase OCH1-like enzyme